MSLKFFGEVADADVKPLCNALAAVRCPGELCFNPDHLECFPHHGPVRIITIGLVGYVAQAGQLFRAN